MTERRRDGGRRAPFLLLSAMLHLQVLLLVAAVGGIRACAGPDVPFAPLEVALVPEAEVAEPKPEPEDKQKEEEEEDPEETPGQVVELPRPREERQPKEARFRSEYDSAVERQTRAPPRPFKPGAIVNRRARRAAPPLPDRARRRVERRLRRLAMRQRAQPDLPRGERPRPEEDPKGQERAGAPERERPRRAPEGAAAPAPEARKQLTLDDLALTAEELERVAGTPVNDALQDIEEGSETLLNSKRWRYASFFNRVKRQVAQNWHPARVYRRRDPTGNVYGFRDRLTVLRVTLTPTGDLVKTEVEKPSGIAFLDEEAIHAFKEAEPFPNPPKGLVDRRTGKISFRFGFLFEISRRASFRIFRFND